MKSKFLQIYNILMEELSSSIFKESKFAKADFIKHTYVKDVINDILNNKKIQLNENGTEEYIFNLSDTDIIKLNDFLNNLNLDNPDEEIKKLNTILKSISNGNVVWSKIYKGKYSRNK